MTRLSIASGPPVALPLAFLGAVPAWGMAGGLLLAVDGADALASRWGPSSLALVHATTLGVLGNAIAGALLQFLPAAAGVRVRGGTAAGIVLFVLLQAGTLALVAGFRGMAPTLLVTGAALALAAFAVLAACVLPGLLARGESMHHGIATAVASLLVTTMLGAAMALGLAGLTDGPAPARWADVHAAWGLLGGALGLLAAVGQVVLPMFQGVAAEGERHHHAWRRVTVAMLVASSLAIAAGAPRAAAVGVAGCAAGWAVSLLLRQARAGQRRTGSLRRAWAAGALAMLLAAGALAAGARAELVGALVLALGLALPVLSMLLEIVAFVGWIDLQRRVPRGVRVPPVQALLPARTRASTLAALAVAGAAVVAATRHPPLAPLAGALLAGAHAALLAAVLTAARRRHDFLARIATP